MWEKEKMLVTSQCKDLKFEKRKQMINIWRTSWRMKQAQGQIDLGINTVCWQVCVCIIAPIEYCGGCRYLQ